MSALYAKSTIDFTGYLAEHNRDFTGREWVFEAISKWLHAPQEVRYFLLTGEPGSGKTALTARLSLFSQSGNFIHKDLIPGFLSAIHFCSARDSTSVDSKNFSRSIGLQLAQQIPQFAQALKDVGEKQVNIRVEQNIGFAKDSPIQGVVIHNLDVSGVMTAQEAFDLVVLNPLRSIYQSGFDKQIIILVDALDEALTHEGARSIIDLLSKLEKLPSQVRFILTSRKEARVENKFFENVQELCLSASEFNQVNEEDVRQYIKKRIAQDEPLSALVSTLEPQQQEEFIERLVDKSEGNFLYVRFMLSAITKGQQSLTELEGLPEGLDGLYYQSLERVVELGKQDWHQTYAPFMGILSVARTRLSLSQIQAFTKQPESVIWKCLSDLRQFLEEIEPKAEQEVDENQYQLYHQSVVDFLRKRSLSVNNQKRHNLYYLSVEEWHQKITDCYWNKAQPLNLVDWYHLDNYAYYHLAYHLFESGRKDDLCNLLTKTPDWMEAKFIKCVGDSSYAADLELVLLDFTNPLNSKQTLALVQLYTARLVVHQRVTYYSSQDLKILVWLGREAEALSHARLTPDAVQRFIKLLAIYDTIQSKGQDVSTPLNEILQDICHTAPLINNNWHEPLKIWALGQVAVRLYFSECIEEARRVLAEAEESTLDPNPEWLYSKIVSYGRHEIVYKNHACEPKFFILDWLRVEAFSHLAIAFSKCGYADKAIEAFTQARQAAIQIDDTKPRTGSYKTKAQIFEELVLAMIKANYLSDAKVVAQLIEDNYHSTKAWCELALALAQTDNCQTEIEVAFAQAEKAAQNIENSHAKVIQLSHLASALTQAGHIYIERAETAFAEALQIAHTLEADCERAAALVALVKAHSQAGHFKTARKIAQDIEHCYYQPAALERLAIAMAKARHPEAEQLAREIYSRDFQAQALTELALVLAQSGDTEQASKIFNEARETTAQSFVENDWHSKAEILYNLASALIQAKHFTEAEQFIQAIENDMFMAAWYKADALIDFASALADFANLEEDVEKVIKLFADAEESIRAIAIEQDKAKMYQKLAYFLDKKQFIKEANRISKLADYTAKNAVYVIITSDNRTLSVETWKESVIQLIIKGYLVQALAELSCKNLDEFFCVLARGAPAFENLERGLSVIVLREAVRIATWFRKDWDKIQRMLHILIE
jgi:DNA polymerase III delta prime subunit